MTTNKPSLKLSLLAVVAASAFMAAKAIASPNGPAVEPRQPDGRGRIALEYLGAKPCRVQDTTSATLCVAGSGMLYELCAYGTAAVLGKGAMAFGTEVASTISNFAVGMPRALSPLVLGTAYVQAAGHSLAPSVTGCWKPAVPVRFESGLTIKLDDASVGAIGIYRLDTGVNP